MEKTLILIKPDAVKSAHIGHILSRSESEGFRIDALKMIQMSKQEAEEFYEVHRERPFFSSLIAFMTSGAVVAAVLCAENAVQKWRELIGATDPSEAKEDTIRRLYAENKEKNAVHGSDSNENATREIRFFFPE